VTAWIWDHPVVAIGLVVISTVGLVAGVMLAVWLVFNLDDGLDADCTGYHDHDGFLCHDGDTCPIHEG